MCYLAFEVGATLFDVGDLAATGISYLRGRASKTELAVTAAGVGAGVFGFGGGYGRAGREAAKAAAGRLIRDATENPGNWRAVGAFTEEATGRKARGGVSTQVIMQNEQGDQLVRHIVRDKDGNVVEDHFRPMYHARDVDQR